MKNTDKLLRDAVRGLVAEDLKNVHGKHAHTSAGTLALRKMHDAPGVLEALSDITEPLELAQVIEAIIDAVPVVRRDEVLRALTAVTRHERAVRTR